VVVQAGEFRQIFVWRTVRRTVRQKSCGEKISGHRLWQNASGNMSGKLFVAKYLRSALRRMAQVKIVTISQAMLSGKPSGTSEAISPLGFCKNSKFSAKQSQRQITRFLTSNQPSKQHQNEHPKRPKMTNTTNTFTTLSQHPPTPTQVHH
jgi:hypothetical protein